MGFVQLSHDLEKWEWFHDKNTFYVYIRLLLDANWGESDYNGVHLKRGQLAISQREYADKCGISRQELRTILERLKATRKITLTSTHKFSIITLVEYDYAAKLSTRVSPAEQPAINPPTLLNNKTINKKKQESALTRGGVSDELFQKFWTAYPKKTAKTQAIKAWTKLSPDEALTETILSALERQKKTVQWTKESGRYIPYPATWLNGRRWEDESEVENGKHKGNNTMPGSESDWLKGFE